MTAINFDWVWISEPDSRLRVRQVYCSDKPIGLVRRWRGENSNGQPCDWFTANLLEDALCNLTKDTHATFRAALEWVVRHGVAR